MHPPCEIMVASFLPAMRAVTARRLHSEGLSQGKIASLIGVTQASVSIYLSRSSGHVRSLRELGISEEDAERYASLLAEDLKKNPMYAVGTLYSIWTNLLGKGLLCSIHRTQNPSLASCDVCVRTFGMKKEREPEPIERVAEAIKMLENSSIFARIMPEVSVNIAYANENARSANDVVAVPGRIVKVKDLPRAFTRPEYGASTHLADVLLEVMAKKKLVRSAMNVRYDQRMAAVLKKLRLNALTIGGVYPERGRDRVLEALVERLRTTGTAFDAVVDLGGSGLEPSLYIFGETPVEVTRLAMRMAREYVSS